MGKKLEEIKKAKNFFDKFPIVYESDRLAHKYAEYLLSEVHRLRSAIETHKESLPCEPHHVDRQLYKILEDE